MRWTTHGLVAIMAVALLGSTLVVGALAQSADDEWVGTLLVARDELDKGIAQIDREVAAIPERIASDDWRVVPTESGQVVQIDLRVVEDYVPMAQVILGHPELKSVLLDAIEQADLGMWESLTATAVVGDIENMTPDAIMAAVRLHYSQSVDDKRDAYAAHQAKLKAERQDLAKLRADIQRELDAIANAAGGSASPEASLEPSPLPSLAPSPDVTPEPSPEPSPDPSVLPSSAPSPCPESDMWCQDEDQEAPPAPSPLPSSAPAEATPGIEVDGVQYDALEGLTACAEDDPACGTMGALMSCWGNELGCYAPAIAPDVATELWSTGVFDGDFEGWGITAHLEQVGSAVSGTIEDRKGPLEIVAEEVSRNRVEGHYFGDVWWQVGRDDGSMGPAAAPFEGCSESRDGTTLWGEVTMTLSDGWGDDREPQTHLTIDARPCDEAWREANPAYDNMNQWLVDGPRTPPPGSAWAQAPVDAARPWAGEWFVDLGSMRIDQQGDQLTGLILSPDGAVTFQAEPMDPALAGDLYDPAVTRVGRWQGDAFASWLAGFGSIPADWGCAAPRDGADQWGDILLRIGGSDGDAMNRIDAAWLPCDEAWRDAIGYNDDYDWWYDREDKFSGWRLRPAAASEE